MNGNNTSTIAHLKFSVFFQIFGSDMLINLYMNILKWSFLIQVKDNKAIKYKSDFNNNKFSVDFPRKREIGRDRTRKAYGPTFQKCHVEIWFSESREL